MAIKMGHRPSLSHFNNQKASLASAYAELGKELSSSKIRVVGNYTLGKIIGEGTYGKVRMGVHRLTSTRVAIKQIPKDVSASLTREIHHHRQLHHPNVCQLYEVIATESYIWLVTELCAGGELFDYLEEKKRLSEEETRSIFGQLCLAVGYAHDKGVVHRDLKLENVLLDERCRVKLGDFGFTREFEAGSLLETFCGTTGYASPEMLEGRKYTGPESDVWSLGIILYTLLVGSLPFDDDDELVMVRLICKGEFTDPTWLSYDVRDLIKRMLQVNSANRPSVREILSHSWIKNPCPAASSSQLHLSALTEEPETSSRLSHISDISAPDNDAAVTHVSDNASIADFHTALSSLASSTDLRAERSAPSPHLQTPEKDTTENPLDSTPQPKGKTRRGSSSSHPNAPSELREPRQRRDSHNSLSSVTPSIEPPLPTRTPVRTKRRSIPLAMPLPTPSNPPSPKSLSYSPNGVGVTASGGMDFYSLLTTPSPLVFTTDVERELLSDLARMGLDTAQMVHSVVGDACDSASAVWWILLAKRRKELENGMKEKDADSGSVRTGIGVDDIRKSVELERKRAGQPEEQREAQVPDLAAAVTDRLAAIAAAAEVPPAPPSTPPVEIERNQSQSLKSRWGKKDKDRTRERTTSPPPPPPPRKESLPAPHPAPIIAPQLAFVPPTPVTESSFQPPSTPPQSNSLGFSNSVRSASTSTPGTPSSSILGHGHHGHSDLASKDSSSSIKSQEKDKKVNKPRSGSIGMLQRATTKLEAAASGLVRKKSDERVKEKVKEREREKEKEKEKERERERNVTSMESMASGSTSSSGFQRFTKSPPPLPKDTIDPGLPNTPERPLQPSTFGSPWVFSTPGPAGPSDSPRSSEKGSSSKSPVLSPADTLTALPQLGKTGKQVRRGNRTSLLVAFKSWFGEDRRGNKLKQRGVNTMNVAPPPSAMRDMGYGAGGTRRGRGRGGRSSHRGSMSSRRSSSVNSRRSSVTSMHRNKIESPSSFQATMGSSPLMRTQSNASRRSQRSTSGNQEVHAPHTPISEKNDFISRPSSIRSFTMNTSTHYKRRSGSPQSSHGSAARMASPLQRYHQRMGSADSGSNTTVVRQYRQTTLSAHRRAGSQASSVQSPASSRRASWYGNELEGEGHPGTPVRAPTPKNLSPDDRTPRRVVPAALVAHKKASVFSGPTYSTASIKRGGSSWKKSWGIEPPGWSSRSTHLPVEISIVTTADTHASIRDVFGSNKRTSMSFEEEDEWEDEDEDEGHVFAPGLGQVRRRAHQSGKPLDAGLLPPPKFKREVQPPVFDSPSTSSKRGGRGRRANNLTISLSHSGPSRQRGGSPIAASMPLPEMPPPGRRIPSGNNPLRGQAPIQEEEEEEEE